MGAGIVIVEKDVDGELWTNSYAFSTVEDWGMLTEADLTLIGMGSPVNDANTNPATSTSYNGATAPLVNSIIAFEREMLPSFVTVSKVYVSDGRKNSTLTDIGGLGSMFAVQALSLSGIRTSYTAADMCPLNISMRLVRVPAGFGIKESSVWYRAILRESEVKLAGRGGIAWTSDSDRAVVQSLVTGSLSAGLSKFFGDGYESVFTGIGHYWGSLAIPPTDPGDINTVSKLSTLVLSTPASRQVKRGRKRST
jgi:hypothetical protein